jgi:hypothetical protein
LCRPRRRKGWQYRLGSQRQFKRIESQRAAADDDPSLNAVILTNKRIVVRSSTLRFDSLELSLGTKSILLDDLTARVSSWVASDRGSEAYTHRGATRGVRFRILTNKRIVVRSSTLRFDSLELSLGTKSILPAFSP